MDYNTQCAANINFIGNSCYPIEVLEEMIKDLCNSDDFKNVKVKYYDKVEKEDSLINVMNLNKINKLKNKNEIEYKKFIVDILNQVMDNIKMEKTSGKGYKNMKKQYNWLLIPLFKNLRNKYTRNDFFRPKGPKIGHQWLSNYDIIDIMNQYEKVYKDYKFLGAVPRDFDNFEKWNFSNKDYNNFYEDGNKKNRFGIIFNLDLSNQSGSHWTALFFDMNKKQIYYQDSVGKPPKNEFVKLMNSIEKQMGNNVEKIISKTKHQKGGSECGVYSTSFILRLLNGENINDIMDNIVDDDTINKCRNYYFNDEN